MPGASRSPLARQVAAVPRVRSPEGHRRSEYARMTDADVRAQLRGRRQGPSMRLEEVAADFLNPLPKPARTSRPTYGTTGRAVRDGKAGGQYTGCVAVMKSGAVA